MWVSYKVRAIDINSLIWCLLRGPPFLYEWSMLQLYTLPDCVTKLADKTLTTTKQEPEAVYGNRRFRVP